MAKHWTKIYGVDIIDAGNEYIASAENCVKLMDAVDRVTGMKNDYSGVVYCGGRPVRYDPMLDGEEVGEKDADRTDETDVQEKEKEKTENEGPVHKN